MTPKYSLPEIERRWSVEVSELPSLESLPFTEIHDLYIDGTRMRLRRMTSADGEVVYKLCKKYGEVSRWTEPITNIYLSEAEYQVFANLPGRLVRKRRFRIEGGSLDVDDAGEMTFEKEFSSMEEAEAYVPPSYVGDERVTEG